MSSPIALDQPCPCGSGALYRECCGRDMLVKSRHRRDGIIAAIVVAAAAIPSFSYMYRLDQEKREIFKLPPGAYYSEEHNHWHDADGQEVLIPGYIWSVAQRRWIKINDALVEQIKRENAEQQTPHNEAPSRPEFTDLPEAQAGVPEPPGEAPEGKVWSAEHGHYHDAEKDV